MSIPAPAPPRRVSRAPRPPQLLSVVREPTPEQAEAPIDWSSWYLRDEDDVGQSPDQDHIIRLFADVLGEFVRLRGLTNVLVGVEAASRRAEVESRRAEAASRRAEAESRRAEVESRRAEAASRRAEAAEVELARLRAELAASKR